MVLSAAVCPNDLVVHQGDGSWFGDSLARSCLELPQGDRNLVK